eukprot:c20008_g1_i1 orf=677-1126(+)
MARTICTCCLLTNSPNESTDCNEQSILQQHSTPTLNPSLKITMLQLGGSGDQAASILSDTRDAFLDWLISPRKMSETLEFQTLMKNARESQTLMENTNTKIPNPNEEHEECMLPNPKTRNPNKERKVNEFSQTLKLQTLFKSIKNEMNV